MKKGQKKLGMSDKEKFFVLILLEHREQCWRFARYLGAMST